MINPKQSPKTPMLGHILTAASIAFILLAIVGFIQFKGSEILGHARTNTNNTISELNNGWTYKMENGTSFSTSLPNNLSLPLHTKQITLTNQLPDTVIPGGGIRFESMMVTVKMYIDGELVKTYGEITDTNHFIYNTASNIIFVPLSPEQYGKEIIIELTSLFNTELGMLEAPKIGSQHDFLLNDLLYNTTNLVLLMMLILFSIILLVFYAVFQSLHNKHLELVAFSIFTFLIALLYNSQNELLWDIFNYSDSLPALNEWFFFIEDAFFPIWGYLVLIMIMKNKLSSKNYTIMGIHGALYIVGTILQLTWILSINYFRPIFMILTLLSYGTLFLTFKPWRSVDETKYYELAVFLIIGAHLLDYLKYLLGFLPLDQKVILWLNLEVPFLFFLPLASIVYIVLLSYALFLITKNDLGDMKNRAQRDLLTGLYNRSTMESFVSTYIESCDDLAGFIVIDINHFKHINDTWGHLYGDEVLKKVARQLELYFGSNDIVARLGGDEFAVFASHLFDKNEMAEKAALVKAVLGEIEIGPPKQNLSASVGFAVYPEHSSYDKLYENSDQAMYHMKKKYR
ncbi:MAG TPA: GGDEF domain-containing protein [Epulopiscium sp.]|nr:GGDEF domain-containing protein [Candidatus Epulonipiscium sp.]